MDGGANRWFTYIDENGLADQIKSPCYLTGDMDSITEASIKRLDALKYQKILTPDQDATDCTKSVIAIEPFLQPNNVRMREIRICCWRLLIAKKIFWMQIETVFLLTDFGGRIDHTMSQIGTLFKLLKIVPQANVYLMGNATLAWLLCPGKHEMEIPKKLVEEEIWCSYIPINGPTCVTTEGLKWDLGKTFYETLLIKISLKCDFIFSS